MAHRVCPWWLGYCLVCPLRRRAQDPAAILAPYIHEGMTVLEPGSGMGFFTLELARQVGTSGRVIAVDIQPKMLDRLKRRAAKIGLQGRLEARVASPRLDGHLRPAQLGGLHAGLCCGARISECRPLIRRSRSSLQTRRHPSVRRTRGPRKNA